jgi:hypothetical protein
MHDPSSVKLAYAGQGVRRGKTWMRDKRRRKTDAQKQSQVLLEAVE